jgi:hypothetical protein
LSAVLSHNEADTMTADLLAEIFAGLRAGQVIPYLGPGVLSLVADAPPGSPEALVARLTAKITVPGKIRHNLTAAAQYIENFKHRVTLTKAMKEAFTSDAQPGSLHRLLAELPLPLLVHAWYDDLPQKALAARSDWGMVQALSQTEHFGSWFHYLRADGTPMPLPVPSLDPDEVPVPAVTPDEVAGLATLLYQPIGSVAPAASFLISDSDFVEVQTEIDIQTPIPEAVQALRTGRHFLFLGCRFAEQLDRTFARQVIKRSSDRHWAVLPEPPTKNEAKFLEEQNITRLDMSLSDFAAALAESRHAPAAA